MSVVRYAYLGSDPGIIFGTYSWSTLCTHATVANFLKHQFGGSQLPGESPPVELLPQLQCKPGVGIPGNPSAGPSRGGPGRRKSDPPTPPTLPLI